jgi:predicted sulfurtransferase
VTGSDHGKVYVFDRRSGVVVDELKMDHNAWVQTIMVRRYNLKAQNFSKEYQAMDIDTVPTIIAAKPEANGEGSQIVVWQKTRAQESASGPKKVEAPTGDRNAGVMQILMFLLSLAFIWQNMEV